MNGSRNNMPRRGRRARIKKTNPRMRVEISYGEVTSAVMISETGRKHIPDQVGRMRFFVEAVDAAGCRVGLWDGRRYDDAILQAHGFAEEFGPVHDLVVEGRA